jgi:ornithine cyclodeaminase
MRETDDVAIKRADLIVVDRRESALREAATSCKPSKSGRGDEAAIAAELADFARGAHAGRASAGQITLFKSVGFALEDLAAAEAVYDAAAATA